MSRFHIFRNSTVEPLFEKFDATFSGYNEIMDIDHDVDYFIWFYTQPINLETESLIEEIGSFKTDFDFIINRLDKSIPLIAISLSEILSLEIETSDVRVSKEIEKFNDHLRERSAVNDNIKIFNFASFFRSENISSPIDWKYYYYSLMVINPRIAGKFSVWFRNQLNALELKRKKCLVLDLDNTLWEGILGEDGLKGVKVGGPYPGNAFADFQAGIKELSKNGIILAICSKNNEADVEAVWDGLVGMKLSKDDFAAFRINWNNKAENIRSLADELNIGLDSFVFIDDSPTERDLIRGMLPMVEVPEFPDKPYELPMFLKQLINNYFQTYLLTSEDLVKTRQYKENVKRTELQKKYSNFDDYINHLNIELMVEDLNDNNIIRIVQMTQKTNQFNLTTHRYTESDIKKFREDGALINCLSAKDRFGAHGITGLIIIKFIDDRSSGMIDTLLLSCRILGKKIEEQFIIFVINKLFKKGFNKIFAEYIPTAKNSQVAEFYDKLGFKCIKVKRNGTKLYELNKDDFSSEVSPNYSFIKS